MAESEGFLRRWSRRKQEVREQDTEGVASRLDEDTPTAGTPERAASDESDGEEIDTETLVSRLPDIDTLTDESDFRPFMDPRIPDALRNRALRTLWRSNPVFANLDGLNDYDEDYTDAAMVVPGLKSAYQVGRGIVRKALDLPAEPEAEPAPTESAAVDSSTDDDQPPDPAAPVTDESGDAEATAATPSGPRNKTS